MKTRTAPPIIPTDAKLETGAKLDEVLPDFAEGVAFPEGDELPEVFALPDPLVNEGVARGVEIPAGRVGVPSTPVKVRDFNGFSRDWHASSNSIGRDNYLWC